MRYVLALVLSATLVFSAHAQEKPGAHTISGSTATAFTEAVERWLEGEDMVALQSLARLSREGNTAAQILLSRIAARGVLHAHVTANLPRKERIQLLRIPEGLSGKSWLSEAQKTDPLAAALLQSARIGERAPAVGALLEMGEPTLALLAAQAMLLQGDAVELIETLQGLDAYLPEEAAVLLVWALYQADASHSGRYAGSARVGTRVLEDHRFFAHELVWVAPAPRDLLEDQVFRNAVADVADSIRTWTPIRNYCKANCGESVQACTIVGASMLGASGPFPMRTPSESLIPNGVYWASSRVEGDLARQIRDVRYWKEADGWEGFREINLCFFESMQKSQVDYGYAK